MDNRTVGWISLLFLLFSTTFGLHWCLTILFGIFIFTIGFLSLLYIQQGDVDRFYRSCAGNPLTVESVSDGGLEEVVNRVTNPKRDQKTDNRVTGSELIDSSLQEILGYIIRDYITPWYNLISLDTEFSHRCVRKTAQDLAINVSNRVKDIDWIPFLTTRLVDDAATHLRLFRQARTKMKNDEKRRSPRNSPRRDVRSSPKKTHKRNKSETDVNWYFGNKAIIERKEIERNVGNSKFYMTESNKKATLEDYFFNLECTMENNVICRDLICMDTNKEREFLSELVELLLYILLPDEDFQCQPLRFILREIFANCVIFPVFTMISDPDYINQAIIWLCLRDVSLPSEIFLTTLRLTDNCDELKCTKELVSKEIQILRSRDSGGESDLSIKQQLSSLSYVIKLIDNRLSKLDNFETQDSISANEYTSPLENMKIVELPLEFILKNNVALSYFIDYVSSQGIQAHLFFYLNIEGWKVSVEQQLSDIHINKLKGVHENSANVYENIRSTALSIYEQYFGEKREQKVDINPGLIHKLFFRIRNLTESPSEQWFDDIQSLIYEKMKTNEEFLPSFKRSHSYLKLLEELDLLNQPTDEDAVSLNSLESFEDEANKNSLNSEQSVNETFNVNKPLKLINSDPYLTLEHCEKNIKHVRSLSDMTDFTTKCAEESSLCENSDAVSKNMNDDKKSEEKDKRSGDFTLNVNIIETGIVSEKGKTFGIYALHVSQQFEANFLEEWHIYRRYSDFHDLHMKVKDKIMYMSKYFNNERILKNKLSVNIDSTTVGPGNLKREGKFPDLSKLTFPGKKTFHNMDRAVLERRMRMLGSYMQLLCQDRVINNHHGLRDLLMTFLEQGEYDRATSGGPISHTIDTLVNPLKSGMKSIKNMPEQLFNTVDEVVEGINKVFHSKQGLKSQEASKVGASIDTETDDNIPLRIMLLLMDEVFDLKSRNQWLRRRIVTLLRQIVRTMFGDIVNRRILDYVSLITSPKNVAHYLHIFKHSFWPNGVKAERKVDRDDGVKYRTRIAAKIALLSCLSDELKHIIGSETTRKGLLTVFELFQKPILNRRLLYVLLEGIICTLFPEKNMPEIFQKLHAKSKRYQDKQKELSTQKPR